VKFRDLVATARGLGADALATGHYARRVDGPNGAELHRAADPARDQSYFLFATTRAQLDFLGFPLGGLPKDETRALARRFDLPVASKPDSQDICFVPSGRYASLVEKLRPEAAEPGEIVHVDGTALGEHRGIIHFTVGQRRGLGVGTGEPLYVVRLEPETRRVVVGPKVALATQRITLSGVNWLGESPIPEDGVEAEVKLRSASKLVPATILPRASGALAVLHRPEYGVAPGQACVVYAGARVLGGGWITRAAKEAA
jgi:tRNA-specific 2-thiouridylase